MATLFLIIIYAAFISLGLPDSLLGVTWPAMQPDFNIPFGFAGIVSMIISGGTIVSSLLSGRILKRFGTGKVTLVSVTMTALALLGFSLAPSFIWIIFLAVPLGLGAGAVDSGLNAYIAEHYESRHMNWLHCFWGLGAILGPLIMAQYINNNRSWRNGYLTVSIIQFVLVVLLLFALPLWDKVAYSLKKDASTAQMSEPEINTAPKSLLFPLRIKGVKCALITFLFYCGLESTMGLWGSSFLVKTKGLDVAAAAAWVACFYGSITLGRLISGFVTMKISNKNLIRIGGITVFIGAVFMLFSFTNIFALIGFILIGLGCAPIFPCMLQETPARFGKENAQAIMGFQMAVAYTGSTLLPPAFGFISTNTSLILLPFFILAYTIVMFISSEKINTILK